MSLLSRFLGGGRNKTFNEGLALLEEGRFAEAADRLRSVALGKSDSPSGSVASYHFRLALVGEGRRLLRAGRPDQAATPLIEAVQLWGRYPDLRCLLGVALGFNDDWPGALSEARAALRVNADYCEARLLEALALQKLERATEAADSLNALVESGRRVEHWVIGSLATDRQFTAQTLPEDLSELLLQAVSGRSEKEKVAAAVALCRAGKWEEGLTHFADLVRKRPRYPDYRTRYAAALFQLGRNEEALTEVEAALALNEAYHTAGDLKGLILADTGRVAEARAFLAEVDRRRREDHSITAHEELFGTYLRAVLALLTGDLDEVGNLLTSWPELATNFARAELLLAAAEDLGDRPVNCGRRLADLANAWPAEAEYHFLLACHHREFGRSKDVARVLSRWPAEKSGRTDQRPLYLEAGMNLDLGAKATLPDFDVLAGGVDRETTGSVAGWGHPEPPAWRYLAARASLLRDDAAGCWDRCAELIAGGFLTERVLRLQLTAAARLSTGAEPGWQPPPLLPDSCLPASAYLAAARGDEVALVETLARQRAVHPDYLPLYWLSSQFWLDPVRSWIA